MLKTPEVESATNGASKPADDEPGGNDSDKEAVEAGKSILQTAQEQINDTVERIRTDLAELDVHDAIDRGKKWVKENPVLAVAAAVGVGLAVGGIAAWAGREPEPEPVATRLRKRARSVSDRAQDALKDVGETVAEQLSSSTATLRDGVSNLSSEVVGRASDYREDVERHAARLAESIAENAVAAAETIQGSARSIAKRPNRKERDAFGSLSDSIRTVMTAFAVKKVGEWLRRIS